MKQSLFLTFLIPAFTFLFAFGELRAESCVTYEAEMKSYFSKYSPDSENYSNVMETYWSKCPRPTPEMNLIYFYAKSRYYLNLYARYKYRRSAYEFARENYYSAARDFQILRIKRFGGEEFWEELGGRIEELEDELASRDPYRRYRDEKFRRKLNVDVSTGTWAKSDWVINVSRGTSRAAENPQRKSFAKKYRYKDGYVDKIPEKGKAEAEKEEDGKEEFGFVGEVEKLTLMEYLEFLGERDKEGDNTFFYDAAAWVESLGSGYGIVINARDSLLLRSQAGKLATAISKVRYGDALAQDLTEEAIYKDDITYIKVKAEGGQEGWVPQIACIPDGALAVITEPVVASIQPGSRLDRGRFILSPGDLVVLSQEKGEFIQVVTRNLEAIGWIDANSGWSIVYDDVVIGLMYHEAMKLPYLVQRRRELEAITLYEGFFKSALSELVTKEIESLKR